MRLNTLVGVALLSLFGLFAPGCDDLEQEVRDAYAGYSLARSSKDPTRAMEFIDPRYVEHLDFVVQAARTADRDTAMRMAIAERMDVAMIRNRLTKAEIAALDGKGWLTRCIKEGWAVDEILGVLDLGKITIKRPRAYAIMEVLGLETDVTMEFVKTGDQWVLDPMALEQLISQELKKRFTSQESENHFILEQESVYSGHPVRAGIWDTPK